MISLMYLVAVVFPLIIAVLIKFLDTGERILTSRRALRRVQIDSEAISPAPSKGPDGNGISLQRA